MHPDGATEAIVDFGLATGKIFACVPCCVYSNFFPSRRDAHGRKVTRYDAFIDYLVAKAPGIITQLKNEESKHSESAEDDVVTVASDIAAESKLLCFDELQVTDVVDAVLLRRLFEGLFARGVRVAFTSNREPERLYERDRTVQGGRHGTRGPPWCTGPAMVHGACHGTRGLALRSPCGR